MKDGLQKITAGLLSASFLLTSIGAVAQPDQNEGYYQHILSYRASSQAKINPNDRVGHGWIIRDPQDKAIGYIYSTDCDMPKFKAALQSKEADKVDTSLASTICERYQQRTSSSAPIHTKYQDKTPVFVIAHAPENNETNQKILDYQFTSKLLPLLSLREDEILSMHHEVGHAMQYFIEGHQNMPFNYEGMRGEGVADAYAILATTRDTGSLYAAGIWSQYRMIKAIPALSSRDGHVSMSITEYFNPYILEAALHKAEIMLKDHTLENKSDYELAQLALEVADSHKLSWGDYLKFHAAVNTVQKQFDKQRFPADYNSSLDKIRQVGGFASDDPLIRFMERAAGFFEYAEAQNLTPRQQSFVPSQPLRHTAS